MDPSFGPVTFSHRDHEASLDEKLTTLLKHLPALRAEGVSCLKIGDIEVLLRPVIPEMPASPEPPRNTRDPARYGLPPDVKLPSLRDR